MNESHRRAFLLHVATGSALLWTASAQAQPVMVSEKDTTAAALGYTADTHKVDARKFPNHKPTQRCGSCQLYTGRPGDGAGGCGIFTGKMVSANGWCSAYVPKA
jgi:High potential iron-sulfur protein